ncbi:MAG: transglycosylase SLT domain-containing protein [Pseudomonadota bacterium]
MKRLLPLLLVLFQVGCVADTASAIDSVPRAAAQHRRTLTAEAYRVWGLDAPVALFAGQVHQESAWNPQAQSPFAAGIAQFTPATASWIGTVDADLAEPAPFNPAWGLRALVIYDRWLYERISAATECDRWAMTLSSYNGGLGWLNRDRKLASAQGADPARWWSHTELYSNRAAWAIRENRDYPRRILLRWAPLYEASGWPRGALCVPAP